MNNIKQNSSHEITELQISFINYKSCVILYLLYICYEFYYKLGQIIYKQNKPKQANGECPPTVL